MESRENAIVASKEREMNFFFCCVVSEEEEILKTEKKKFRVGKGRGFDDVLMQRAAVHSGKQTKNSIKLAGYVNSH